MVSKAIPYPSKVEEELLVAVGKGIAPRDSFLKVTGKAVFGYDFKLPHMLYGKIKHAMVPHAEIVKIDVSEAAKLPGVRCIVTGLDAPKSLRGIALFDTPTLAYDRVRYMGEPVAAVAADDPETAEEAVERIWVEYKELPAVFDPEEAMKPGAPILHPDLPKYGGSLVHGARVKFDIPNVNNYHKVVKGDVEKGFEKSYLVVENKYENAMTQHSHIEPNACVCTYSPDGILTVYTSTQAPYRIRFELSKALGIPENRIRIVGLYCGGGFGNKLTVGPEAICALLAIKSRRPVKMALTREEVFWFTTVRHPHRIYIKDGVSKDGRLLARYIKTILNGGAYSGGSGIVTTRNAAFALGTYNVENVLYEAFRVYTNLPPGGAFRGFGSAQIDFAIEQQMDILAKELGMDPVEFRLKNIVRDGEINVFGELVKGSGHEKVLLACADALGWKERHAKPKQVGPWKRGFGVALVDKYTYCPAAASAMVKVLDDGTIELYASPVEIGCSAPTVLSQMVAEEFKVPIEKVRVVPSDTEFTPFDEGAFSSRTTIVVGNAVIRACRKAKENIAKYAAKILGEAPEDLDVREGYVISKRDPSKRIKIEDLFARGKIRTGVFLDEEGVFIGAASWLSKGGILDPETGRIVDSKGTKISERAVTSWNTAATGVELEVNVETGQVRIVKLVGVADAGKAINPRLVKSQIISMLTMGMGLALYEGMVWDNGLLVNPDFKDYKLVNVGDLPQEIKTVIVEVPNPIGPYGAKGVGEAVIASTVPAIANAICDAIGARFFNVPITAEMILKKLEEGGGP